MKRGYFMTAIDGVLYAW